MSTYALLPAALSALLTEATWRDLCKAFPPDIIADRVLPAEADRLAERIAIIVRAQRSTSDNLIAVRLIPHQDWWVALADCTAEQFYPLAKVSEEKGRARLTWIDTDVALTAAMEQLGTRLMLRRISRGPQGDPFDW